MNCGICLGHLREQRHCPGCNLQGRYPEDHYLRKCIIRLCRKREGKANFCFVCDTFPCPRLKRLDKRYRTRYGMSMLENLELIKTKGIRYFVKREKTRWKCPACGEILCVHRPNCLACGKSRTTWKVKSVGK